MLKKQVGNLWANNYNKIVQIGEETNLYPFAGYKEVFHTIFTEVMKKKESSVLDIGFGPAVLTYKLYEKGHYIDGLDYSAIMLELAEAKMPKADLIEWEIIDGLPEVFKNNQYDAIISTYVLHDLSDKKKLDLIEDLLPLLTENGRIFIGDVAFESREKLEICRRNSINYWIEDENYFVYDEIKALLANIAVCEFRSESHCAGVLTIKKK